jgi:hypothetical protein
MIRMRRRISLWLLIGLCLVGLTTGDALALASPASPIAAIFFGGFGNSTLSSRWSWVREDAGAWSLAERPGFLRIHT